MEQGRDDQIADLIGQGWYIDAECEERQRTDRRMGGATYIKSPTGVMHAAALGEVEPLVDGD